MTERVASDPSAFDVGGTRQDELFEALSHPHRRFTLQYLRTNETPVSVAELATALAVWERERTEAGRGYTDADEIGCALVHTHVPKLAEAGFVTHDETARTVAPTGRTDGAALAAVADPGAIENDRGDETVSDGGRPQHGALLAPVTIDEPATDRQDSEPEAGGVATVDGPDVVRDTYEPARDRTLTDAVLDAIERCVGDDRSSADCSLFDDVDPKAFDEIFRDDAEPTTRLSVTTDAVRVDLWGDDGIEIRVTRTDD